MSRHSGGTRDGTRSSALWGTGNRGGDSRANALWGKGGRGLLAILTVLFVTMIPLAQASRNPNPSTYLDPLLEAKAHETPNALVNVIIVFIKVAIVIVFISVGWGFINPANHEHYLIPDTAPGHEETWKHGFGGVMQGASIVFFAFIGFDAVSTAAQESKKPERDMPIGILGSLAVCTVLYILFGHVLTGVAPWSDFDKTGGGKEASVAYAISTYMKGYDWLATAVTVAILAGFSSVILVMLLGQSRVFHSMASDGLVPKVFAELHPKFRTPYKSNMILFVFVGLFAGFIPDDLAGDLTSFGTLLAFVLVCLGIWIMRAKSPDTPRPFRTPMVPLVPLLGILVCGTMIYTLDAFTLKVAFGWMALGLLIYFGYSRRTSKLNVPA